MARVLMRLPLTECRDGSLAGMDKDPDGVGFREYQLLAKRHNFSLSRKPYNISNMPGEERWRV